MQTELEIAYTKVDHDALRNIIIDLGGVCIQEKTLMKRVILKPEGKKLQKAYFRVRDEGNKITCSYKSISDGSLNIYSVKEVETEIQNFDAMIEILSLTGLQKVAYQESYRETWRIGESIEFMLDEWPGIKPFIELEGKNEELVKQYSKKLGFDYSLGVFGGVDQIYFRETGISHDTINSLKEISFRNPPII